MYPSIKSELNFRNSLQPVTGDTTAAHGTLGYNPGDRRAVADTLRSDHPHRRESNPRWPAETKPERMEGRYGGPMVFAYPRRGTPTSEWRSRLVRIGSDRSNPASDDVHGATRHKAVAN